MPNPPQIPPDLLALARAAAARHNLDPALICAIVEQESVWNPWAIRFEPAFFAKYIGPLFTNNKVNPPTNTEAYSRAYSWGLMQVMGQSARERGYDGEFLSALCEPAAGLEAGCELFAHKLAAAEGKIPRALALWNGGANPDYASQVLARAETYRDIL
jgi:soluble lytic murein transglycosylase-like protein